MNSQTWTTCSHCGVSLKTSRLAGHRSRCPKLEGTSPPSRSVHAPAPKRLYPVCTPVSALPPASRPAASASKPRQPKPTSERLTKDGYRIDTCWQCKRRICLVPTKHSDRVHEIDWRGHAADRHCCDGPDGALDSLDRADSFSSQRAAIAIRRQIRFGPKKRS